MQKQKKILTFFYCFFLIVFLVKVITGSFDLFASTNEHLESNSILNITNLSPDSISVLQDDPDDPQNNDWLTADSHDSDTFLRVDFSDPINSLKEGTDLQEFRVLIRSTDNGAEDPKVSLHLYEEGNKLRLLKTKTATSTEGQVIVGNWDASELTDTEGSNVELKVVGSSTDSQSGERDTVEVGAVSWIAEIEEADIIQDQFRFYKNRDNKTPTVDLANENEPAMHIDQDEVIRLRINAYPEKGGIPKDSLTLDLQYAYMGEESDCSSVATSSFGSVGDIGSDEVWRGYSNSTPVDGEDLVSKLLSSSDILGTYEEEVPTVPLPREVKEEERIEWDFVIQNNEAYSGGSYCFRLVKEDGEELKSYENFPQVQVVRGLTQVKYRWRNDDGSEVEATWREEENTPSTILVDENYRLRFQIDNEGNVSDTADLELEYATSTTGPWNSVLVDNPECDLTSSAFRICNSDFLTDGATTTRKLSEITGSTFIPGYILDDSNPSSVLNFEKDEFTEMEWAIQATEKASPLKTYYFRLSDSGESIGIYSDFPEVEVEADNALLFQNYYRWYDHNDQLTPESSWDGLGENTAITSENDPLSIGDVIRLRMSLSADDGFLPKEARKFDLQYAKREGSCSTTGNWSDVGSIGSEEIWRGVSTNVSGGTELSDLLLSVSDVAGTFEEENPSVLNPNRVSEGEDIEYDWVLENNDAEGDTAYCFRMVKDNGSELSGYSYYPVLTTAGFSPETDVWRWYGDAESITPTDPLSSEGSAPVDVDFDETIKLRTVVKETEGIDGEDKKFRLQFSESSSFSSGGVYVEEMESCEDGKSVWCYDKGGGEDNSVISESLLSTADSCVDGVGDGCGTHNESGTSTSDFLHKASASVEYEFTIRQAGANANTTYFFRLVEVSSGDTVYPSEGESFPSLSTKGADLSFSIGGVSKNEEINSVITTDVSTTPNSIAFGKPVLNQRIDAAQRKKIKTNAPNGFQLFMYTRSPFMNSKGESFESIEGTNKSPESWSSGCEGLDSCYGYHAGDDTLEDGSNRFAPADSFAAFTQTPAEIGYSGIPDREYSVDTVMSLEIGEDQPPGNYSMNLVYVIVPIF